jgi:hypothetical protein
VLEFVKNQYKDMDTIAKTKNRPSTKLSKLTKPALVESEVKRIVQLLDDDDDALEDAYFNELADSRANDEIVGIDELIKALKA